MGQYYYIVNLDKKQYLHPHAFGDGLKLMEFGCSGEGTLLALAALLADGNGQGFGDLKSDDSLVGSWAGDRIVVAGDYAAPGHWGVEGTLYDACGDFENISLRVRHVLESAGCTLPRSW